MAESVKEWRVTMNPRGGPFLVHGNYSVDKDRATDAYKQLRQKYAQGTVRLESRTCTPWTEEPTE